VQQQVVAADINNDSDVGTNRGNVGEVLVRPDADVGATGDTGTFERREHVQVGAFVRDQVVGVEVAAGLGKRRHTVGERFGRRRRRRQASSTGEDPDGNDGPGTDEQRSHPHSGILARCA